MRKFTNLAERRGAVARKRRGKNPKGPNTHQSVEEGRGRERSLGSHFFEGGNTPTQGPAQKAEGQVSRVQMYRAEPIEYRGENPLVPGGTRSVRQYRGKPVMKVPGKPVERIPGDNP